MCKHTRVCYLLVEDLERMDRTEEERLRDLAILDASQAAFKDVPAEEVEQEVAKAIAEVRAENRVHAGAQARQA
jgi:hypothetical protein